MERGDRSESPSRPSGVEPGIELSEAKGLSLEPFFQLSLDLVCIAGTDGYFRRINPAFLSVLGYEREQLLALSFAELVHPDDRASTAAVVEQLARGQPTVHFENRYRCADGSYKWLQWTVAPDAKGELLYGAARDITESKGAEEQRKARERELTEAQAIAGVGSWTWDLGTNVLTWSAELYRILGLEPFSIEPNRELYARAVYEPDRKAFLQRAVSRHVAPYSIEYRLCRPDGELRMVQAQARTIFDDRGTPIRRIGTVQDVTERKRAEQESQLLARVTREISNADDLHRALQLTLRALCEAEQWDYGEFWFPRPDGTVLECFEAYASHPEQLKTFRERSEALVCEPQVTLPGRVWTTGRPEWHPDLSGANEDVFCRIELARAAGLRTCVGVPLVVEDSVAAVLVLLRHRPTPEDARQLTVLNTITAQLGVMVQRKQTEDALRRSEERFQIAALATNDVIYDWSFASDIVEFGESLRRNFGYPERSVPVKWWGDLIHPEDHDPVFASLGAAIEGDDRSWTGEYRFRRADGSYAHVMDRGYLSRGADGKGTRMIGSMLDLTERVRAAERLREAKEVAEAAGRAKSEFLANMSHEIRTPLTAVLGFADLLLDPKLGQSERLNYAMTIRRNGEHLLSLLNDILDISKIEAGKLQLETIECSPAQVLTDVASLMRVRAVEKGLSFEVEYTGPMPTSVRTDPTRLRQIVLNLVSNAIKFTEQGSVRVLAACDEQAGASRLTVAVQDTGIGISSEHQAQLFKPFQQADASMSRRYGGSGLGLGICAPLAAALGGVIDVESAPGRGSTFTLRVPVEITAGTSMLSNPKEALTSTAERSEAAPVPVPQTHGMVLLAEDGRDNQVLISRLLRKHGFEVTIVENGRLAVDRVLAAQRGGQPYDIILMDMQMPELDGYGATAELRAHGYEGSIVALTAHAMAGERERCLAAGCNDYLTKPIDRTALIAAVQGHVRKAQVARGASQPPLRRASTPGSDAAGPQPHDSSPLRSEFADDPDMADIVASFVEGLPGQLAALADASTRADHATLARLSHQLKGAAGGYGFPMLTVVAAKLEEAAKRKLEQPLLATALEEVRALVRRTQPDAASSASQSEAVSVLLAIDDSAQIQALIEARLRSEGIRLHQARDANEGIRLARELLPDVILLDLDLPDASGLDVCRELKSDPQTGAIPIVFLTGATDATIKATALDLGAADYVTKPFDAVELRARVRSVLRTKRLQDLLTNRAQLDGLTGLWNRAHFDVRLKEEEAAVMRHHRPLAIALLDVDHFKRINDTYGHPVGDQVLQAIASALRKTLRSSDIVCRYGGEEFALILRDTSLSAAVLSAERLRAALSEIALTARGQRVSVTASFGVAAVEGTARGAFASGLVLAADAALYSAKRAGRNQVASVALDT